MLGLWGLIPRWWFRNPAFTSWGKGSLSHYLQGTQVGAGFLQSTVWMMIQEETTGKCIFEAPFIYEYWFSTNPMRFVRHFYVATLQIPAPPPTNKKIVQDAGVGSCIVALTCCSVFWNLEAAPFGSSSIPNSALFFGNKYGIKICRDMKIQHLGNT